MGATVGTKLMIWWKGERVGEDEFANKYYQEKKGRRRWVIYGGVPEASAVPPDWHAWLHHTVVEPPLGDNAPEQPAWGQEHRPNQTGTAQAYYPPGSILSGSKRPQAGADYEAWTPK